MTRCAVVLSVALVASPAICCPGLEPGAKPYLGELTFSAHNGLSDLSLSSRAGGTFNLRDCHLQGLGDFRGDGLVRIRPSLLLHWHGDASTLVLAARFAEPVLLLVHDPDGNWLLDDGLARQPQLTVEFPAVGDYAVYLGTHGAEGFTRPGTLIISEVRP